ncbi:MAG: hypothetical protein ABI300_07005 [Rhodanobacter sp.]
MTDITVKLDIHSNPQVSCEPPTFHANKGNQQIKWKPGGSQKFTFAALTGLSKPPFSSLNVTADEITVHDDDSTPGTYGYQITVVADADHETYSTRRSPLTDPVPCIKNT